MWYIGVDAHKKRCSAVAKDEQGNVVLRRSFEHTRQGWKEALAAAPKGSKVAVECVGWYQAIFDLLEDLGLRPVLVHARGVALIATSKKKTDRRDAETLCDLLRTGFLPTSHVPSKETRELRELTRHLDRVVKNQVRVKNQVHRLLERAWIQTPDVTDLFGKKGRTWLRGVVVSPAQRVVLDALLEEFRALEDLRDRLEGEVARRVEHDEDVGLLLTLDGVGVVGAATLRAELDTAARFANRKQVRSNFGLAPSVRDSAETTRRGRITKQGPGVVRKVVVQASRYFAKSHPRVGAKQARLVKRRGKGVARVAVAGEVLDTAYQMLKTRTAYRYATPRLVETKRRHLVKMARRAEAISVS